MADQLPAEEDLDRLPTDEELARLQRTTVLYYLHETNPDNGLVRDKTDPDAPCSIAAVGLALATIPVVVERGVLIRKFAAKIARRRLRSLLEPPAGTGAGRRRVQGLLLPLPRHRDRPPRLEVRALHARLGVPVRGRAHLRHLLRRRHGGRGRGPPPGRRALPPGRLGLGVQRRPDAHPRLEARDRLPAVPLRGLRRGALALPSRPRLADPPAAAGELRRLLRHLPVEGDLRPRVALLRAAVHPPALAPVDRLPRHPRRVHARARQRLLREQPAGDLRAAGVRDPEPAAASTATGSTAGASRPATARAGSSGS